MAQDTGPDGLTQRQVAERRAAGQVNEVPTRSSRSIAAILRANVLTWFNGLIGTLFVIMLAAGPIQDALFGFVIIANALIGIVQETRAKRTLDSLAIIGEARPTVRRDGVDRQITAAQIVLGDLVLLNAGDKIPVDGPAVLAEALEVDESLLTGEADPVVKQPGDELLSGSFAVAGHGSMIAAKIGSDAHAAVLAAEAQEFTLVRSELRDGINQIIKYLTYLLIPAGILQIIVQAKLAGGFRNGLSRTVAGIVPMVPEGLVLLTSVAFAVGVIRLGRRQCLVQELPAIEGLARVDTVCLDKTGTLTEGGMRVARVHPPDGSDRFDPEQAGLVTVALSSLGAAETRPNGTMTAVIEAFPAPAPAPERDPAGPPAPVAGSASASASAPRSATEPAPSSALGSGLGSGSEPASGSEPEPAPDSESAAAPASPSEPNPASAAGIPPADLTSPDSTSLDIPPVSTSPGSNPPTLIPTHGPAPDPSAMPPLWQPTDVAAFSSARKWSGAAFDGQGSWLLGAPDVLATGPAADEAQRLGADGMRILLLGRSKLSLDELAGDGGPARPGAVEPVALLALEQRVRDDAAPTLAYFERQRVSLKVISGDNAVSVGAVAASLGLPGAEHPVDARTLPGEQRELGAVVTENSVFGRVTPRQKQQMVTSLQGEGHVVAMTGDGVNDVLALKSADIGVAMGSGSGAARAVAQIVLLDEKFATLPDVVAEGRRVVGNIERVSNLFLVKSFESFLMVVLTGIARLPYPFLPRHTTLVGALTIGTPAFFLALAPNIALARTGFVRRVLRFTVPAGMISGTAAFVSYNLARTEPGSLLREQQTSAMVTLFTVSLWVLTLVARPFAWWKYILVGAMGSGFLLVALTPFGRRIFDLDFGTWTQIGTSLLVTLCAGCGLELLWRWAANREARVLKLDGEPQS